MNKDNKIDVQGDIDNPIISVNNDTWFTIPYKINRFIDEKELIKFIKSIERQIRSSQEYRLLMNYLKTELNFDSCIYLNTLSSTEISVELHHNPYTLYDLVEIIINKYETNNIPFNSFMIANDVMFLHYNNIVGLVPLSKTMHELVHNNPSLQIHKDLHIGKVDIFYQTYEAYMNETHRSKYKTWINYSEEYKDDKFNNLDLFNLDKREVYLNSIDDVNDTSKLEFDDNDTEEYPMIGTTNGK